MTELGFEYLRKEIEEKIVDVPKDMDLKELRAWMLGYKQSQDDALSIITEMEKK